MIEYVILYVIVSLLFRGSVVQSSRGSKFPGFQRFPSFQSSVGSMPSKCWSVRFCLVLRLCLSGRDTGRDGSY
jgi:hypothetical protein